MGIDFAVQGLVMWINLPWLLTTAAVGKYSVRQVPDSLSVREGDPIRLGCAFNSTGGKELETVVFKWTARNFSIEATETISNMTYYSESSGAGVRIEANLAARQATLIVDHATTEHSGVYICEIVIVKPLGMQKVLYGNGTTVTVREARPAFSLIEYMVMIGLLLILIPTVCLLMRIVCQGKTHKTVCASTTSRQELGTNQRNEEREASSVETIYSSLSLSMMRPPGKNGDGKQELTIYASVHCPASSVSQSTISHAVELKPTLSGNQHFSPQ